MIKNTLGWLAGWLAGGGHFSRLSINFSDIFHSLMIIFRWRKGREIDVDEIREITQTEEIEFIAAI